MNLPFGIIIGIAKKAYNKFAKFLFLKTIQQSDGEYWEHKSRQLFRKVGGLIEYRFEFDNENSLQARNTRLRIKSICDIEFETVNVSIETLTINGYITEVLHFGKVRNNISSFLETKFPPYNIHIIDGKIVPTFKELIVNFIEFYDKDGQRYHFGKQRNGSICMPINTLYDWAEYDGVSYNISALNNEKLETYFWINSHFPRLTKIFIQLDRESIVDKFPFLVHALYWSWIWTKIFILRRADILKFDMPIKNRIINISG